MAVAIVAGAATLPLDPAVAEPVARGGERAGAVIARKAGEEIRFVEVDGWRYVDLDQALATGDVLRTNATGQLAVLFSDRTQVRLGRNTSLIVKKMETSGDSGLALESGTIWARAERGGTGVTIDTPAATAAVRGTDWTLSVDAKGQTSLLVLDGSVELANGKGRVTVGRGEGAIAGIGQAPRKIVIADPKDREQMLFYLSLRDVYRWMPSSPLSARSLIAEESRIGALPEAGRSGADWLTLAEAALELRGRAPAAAALARAEAAGLSASEAARADLVRAILAGAEGRHGEAATLFARAEPRLDAKRRAIAAYGGYFSRSLADPNRSEAPPRMEDGPFGAFADAFIAGMVEGIPAAFARVEAAERRYPSDPTLPAARAQLALFLGDREAARAGIDRSMALEPGNVAGLEARAHFRSSFEGDLDGALADVDAALAIMPGSTTLWDLRGHILSGLDATREAERAFRRAIELQPEDAVSRANLAILLLDENRVAEAKEEIDRALALDPGYDLTLIARGRYHMQVGDREKALEDLLAGSVANPGVAAGQTMLAAAHFERRERVAAIQALDNADRLDPEDASIAALRTSMAIDAYDSETAMASARAFLKRSRAKGGRHAALSGNQAAGSSLNAAFRLQGLDAWGQYYGDAVFNPFSGSSYLDQTIRGSVDPFATSATYGANATDFTQNSLTFSALVQGLMLEPHMLAGRTKTPAVVQSPFLEGALGGGFTRTGHDWGWTSEAELQGYTNAPFPISAYGQLVWESTPDLRELNGILGAFATETEIKSGTAYLTANPTPDDRVVAYASRARSDDQFELAFLDPASGAVVNYYRNKIDEGTNAGIGWSHSFDHRSIVNAALFYSGIDAQSGEAITADGVLTGLIGSQAAQKSRIAAVNHLYGSGDLTWRYGIEGGTIDIKTQDRTVTDVIEETNSYADARPLARAYADALYEISPTLKAEGALFYGYLGGDADVSRLEPRLGLAWAPADGQWLRAAYLREGLDLSLPTLSPIGIVGIQSNQRPLSPIGYSDTLALRWEAEWSDRLFTAVDVQHQTLNDLSIAIPLSADTIDLAEGRIDRVGTTANLALGHGFGLSGTASYTASEDLDPASAGSGRPLPYLPEWAGQVAVTFVSQANLKAQLAANYTGTRESEAGTADLTTGLVPPPAARLGGYWTLDAALTWEPLDKAVAFNLEAYNLLDEEFEVAPNVPGWGRAFKASVKVRF
ncbi:FecR domain-containing protein [Ensifer soli]|uniref:FecR domain-containing protein n=1 Tax=Ciceribacter sp. sgz301302 TaxID=3342379 RepID=UPI0035BA6B79